MSRRRPHRPRPAGGWCGAGVTGGLEVGSGPEARPRSPIGLGEAPRVPTSLKSQLFPTKKLHQKQEGFQRNLGPRACVRLRWWELLGVSRGLKGQSGDLTTARSRWLR